MDATTRRGWEARCRTILKGQSRSYVRDATDLAAFFLNHVLPLYDENERLRGRLDRVERDRSTCPEFPSAPPSAPEEGEPGDRDRSGKT